MAKPNKQLPREVHPNRQELDDPSGVQLRPARQHDLAAVRKLLSAAGLPLDGVQDGFSDGYVVAESDKIVVGTAGIEIHDHFGLLRSVVVLPGLQGSGIGRKLVADRVAWAEAHQLRALYLLTTSAAKYFSRFGFAVVTRAAAPPAIQASVEFREACPVSATVMYRPLERDVDARAN